MFASGVVYNGGKFAASVVDTGGKFAPVVIDTRGKLPPVLLTPVANLPLVPVTQHERNLWQNLPAGVDDTGSKLLFFVKLIFFIFIFYDIHTFIQSQYIYPSPFAEASLHFLIA